jgi:hypothetical protein
MRRWTKFALCVLALGIVAAPAPAQKILGDSSVGYNLYAHNWLTLHNGMDIPGGGNYVYFFGGPGLFGGGLGQAPNFADSIRKCWNNHFLRGHQESTNGATYNVSMWNLWLAPSAGAIGGYGMFSGPQTIYSIGNTAGGDFCLDPYTANPYALLGGFGLGGVFYGNVAPGAIFTINWRFVKGPGGQGSAGIAFPAMATLNNSTVLLAEMIYDLQHGYNGTIANQQYIGTVSIDELTYPVAGGIAGGDTTYGFADWGGYVNNGVIVSYTRVFDVTLTNNGGFVGLLAYPGQTAEGNFDGFETMLTVAQDHMVTMMGRNPGEVAYPDGSGGHYFGAGGRDWVSCGTSTGLGSGTNKFQLRSQDLFYSQLTSPGGVNNDPSTDNTVCYKWSLVAPGVGFNTSGVGAPRPLDLALLSLDHGMGFDFITGAFDSNGKAIANIKYSIDHTGDNTASPLGIPVVFEGNWSGANSSITTGTYELPRGRTFAGNPYGVLSLCHPKAVAQILASRTFYINGIMRSAAAGTSETGAGWASHETGTVERAPVAAN